jgi:hypothetical protein
LSENAIHTKFLQNISISAFPFVWKQQVYSKAKTKTLFITKTKKSNNIVFKKGK